jgi:hypothetical protein
MNVLEKPRDIEKRTFDFGLRIIKLCQFLEGRSWVNSTLGKQLLRCGTSIGSNVEEAQAAESRADFISKNNILLKRSTGNSLSAPVARRSRSRGAVAFATNSGRSIGTQTHSRRHCRFSKEKFQIQTCLTQCKPFPFSF